MFKLKRTRIPSMQLAVNVSETLVTLKQNQGHQTYNVNVDPSKVIVMQCLKDLALMVSEKKPMLIFLKVRKCHMQK